jgi:hypothetical protein
VTFFVLSICSIFLRPEVARSGGDFGGGTMFFANRIAS